MVTFLEDPKSGAQSSPDLILTQEWRMATVRFSEILIKFSYKIEGNSAEGNPCTPYTALK